MRRYFIDATRELLKAEGLVSVNVRNVAEKAGYSYATLYNYFKDLNDLVFECVKDFQLECEAIVRSKTEQSEPGKEQLKTAVLSYVQYFVEYPGVFELFFLERMGKIGNRQSTSELIYTFLDRLCEPYWEYCLTQNLYSREVAAQKRRQLRFAVMGMLLFYQNRFQPETYPDFMALLNEQLDEILAV